MTGDQDTTQEKARILFESSPCAAMMEKMMGQQGCDCTEMISQMTGQQSQSNCAEMMSKMMAMFSGVQGETEETTTTEATQKSYGGGYHERTS